MKTFSASKALFLALLIVKVAMPFSSMAGQRVKAVIINNKVIPAVELKEVVITAERPTTLCKAVNRNGEIIPLVEMKEVNISASGNSIKGNEGIVAVKIPGIRTRAIAWRGEMIPQVDGPEVIVTAIRNQPTAQNNTGAVEEKEADPALFKVSVRQTFDKVSGFILDQAKELLSKVVTTGF